MNFIDMYVEWLETLEINKANAVISNNDGWTKEDEERLGLKSVQSEPITQEEIDEDYENLDLSQFDKK